jgi:DNA polymerase-1
MEILSLTDSTTPKSSAILIKESTCKPSSVYTGYHNYFGDKEVMDSVALAPLYYAPNNKVTAADARQYILELLSHLAVQNIMLLYVADSTYFKVLTGKSKSDPWRGYVLPCTLKGFENFKVVLGYNYNVLFHNPNYEPYILTSIDAFVAAMTSQELAYTKFKYKEHQFVDVHKSTFKYTEWMNFLLSKPTIALDIEAFSLKFYDAGIATVTFAWSETEAITMNVDLTYNKVYKHPAISRNEIAFEFLREFLYSYKGKLLFHNASYDVKVLIFEIFMNRDFFDYEGMRLGIETLCRDFEDTKLIEYCVSNNAVSNKLSLKESAHAYVGNYAQTEINDVTQIPLGDLLTYNGTDGVATFWVWKNKYPLMVKDNQEGVYNTILKPSVKLFLQAELVGIPLDGDRVDEVIALCEADKAAAVNKVLNSPLMADYKELKATHEFDNQHIRWKKKRETMQFFRDEFEFNPNSNDQVADFLYEYIGFEAIEFTDTGKPSTSKDALAPLKFQTDDKDMLEILEGLAELSEVNIILTNFLSSFKEKSILKSDGVWWLHGSHNIGGTKSGRLSSSDPNLQNMPVRGKYGKLVKSCVVAPKGWLLIGADFASLEDRIDALLTKDTNKIKVYTDGFDGHSLRAAYYYSDQLPQIDPNCVTSVNSIKEVANELRDASKPITFALTYLGTWTTIHRNCGIPKEKAKEIVFRYHELYKESDEYKDARLLQASKDGYATLAFGLRIRCKVLASSIFGSKRMTSAAQAEMRTIGNAFGQSYGMLNNRAGIAFQRTVFKHPVYWDKILPIMHIHDAQYFLIIDDLKVLHFCNEHIPKEMSWQELPEIQHDLVKLGGEVDVFIPSWEEKVTIPNGATLQQIKEIGDSIDV